MELALGENQNFNFQGYDAVLCWETGLVLFDAKVDAMESIVFVELLVAECCCCCCCLFFLLKL
jgi:hypothetical protein